MNLYVIIIIIIIIVIIIIIIIIIVIFITVKGRRLIVILTPLSKALSNKLWELTFRSFKSN